MMPESPWIMTSLTSCGVLATRAILEDCPDSTRARTHSAPVRVLPKPRPARSIQMRHRSSDGSWFFLAHNGQWNFTSDATCSGRSASISSKAVCLPGCETVCKSLMIESGECLLTVVISIEVLSGWYLHAGLSPESLLCDCFSEEGGPDSGVFLADFGSGLFPDGFPHRVVYPATC